jgi:hypothetical protein
VVVLVAAEVEAGWLLVVARAEAGWLLVAAEAAWWLWRRWGDLDERIFLFCRNVCSASILSHVDVLIHFQMPCIDSDPRQRYFTVRATKSAQQRSFTRQKICCAVFACVFEKTHRKGILCILVPLPCACCALQIWCLP